MNLSHSQEKQYMCDQCKHNDRLWELKPFQFLYLTPSHKQTDARIYLKTPIPITLPITILLIGLVGENVDLYSPDQIHRYSANEILLMNGLMAFPAFKRFHATKQDDKKESKYELRIHFHDNVKMGHTFLITTRFIPINNCEINDSDSLIVNPIIKKPDEKLTIHQIKSYAIVKMWLTGAFDIVPEDKQKRNKTIQIAQRIKQFNLILTACERQIYNWLLHWRKPDSTEWMLLPSEIIYRPNSSVIISILTPSLTKPLTVWLLDQETCIFQDVFYWNNTVYINDLTKTNIWNQFENSNIRSMTLPLGIRDSNGNERIFKFTIKRDK